MKRAFRLLVVDDDVAFLNQVVASLSSIGGLTLYSASSADEAIELLPHVDAVLADCVFPNAFRLEEAVRQSGKPMVRMSGQVGRAPNLELLKPFTPKELLESIELLRFLHSPQRQPLQRQAVPRTKRAA
jgi:CheY-like chemotaxis protein